MTRSPILRTTSPSARDARARCRSTLMSSASSSRPHLHHQKCCTRAAARPVSARRRLVMKTRASASDTRRRTKVSRTSRSMRGVLGTTVFQTSTAACRTPCTASRRAMYNDEMVLRQAAPPMRLRSLFAVSSSPKAASASSNSATPTCLASPIRQSNSPNKRAAASRRRHLGQAAGLAATVIRRGAARRRGPGTSCLPANNATSRIASASSANPSSTAFNASCTWSPKWRRRAQKPQAPQRALARRRRLMSR